MEQDSQMEQKRRELLHHLTKAEALAKSLQEDLAIDTKFRTEVVEKSKHLTRTLQTPIDQSWDIFFQPHHLSILATALNAGWLHSIEKAGDQGMTADELALSSSADASLVKRLLRFLAAAGTIEERGANTYSSTPLNRLLCSPQMAAGLRHASHDYAPPVSKMPEYFASNGYQTPHGPKDSIYSYAYGASFFHFLSSNPAVAEPFNVFMAAAKSGKKSWLDVYPLASLGVSSGEEIMLVDVGGGKGHELVELAARKESLKLQGRLVLQDLPNVVDKVPGEWSDLFTSQAHDFMRPQPRDCVHARAYYLRNVCHALSDTDCVAMLTCLRDAMEPGYSSLLINEIVLPDQKCSYWGAAFDISMMAVVNGKERTRQEWEHLISSVSGLKIEKVWALEDKGESLLEVVRIE